MDRVLDRVLDVIAEYQEAETRVDHDTAVTNARAKLSPNTLLWDLVTRTPDDGQVEEGRSSRLDLDSLDRSELRIALEDEFEIEIPDDEMARTRTIQSLAEMVQRLLSAGPSTT